MRLPVILAPHLPADHSLSLNGGRLCEPNSFRSSRSGLAGVKSDGVFMSTLPMIFRRYIQQRHRRSGVVVALGILLAVTGPPARSGVIISITGGDGQQSTGVAGVAEGFSTPVAIQGVTITAFLGNGNSAPSSGTAFLTPTIGPGTTLAQVIARSDVTVSCFFCAQTVTLFTGLDLAAGSYWISFTSPQPPASFLNWEVANSATITTTDGAQYVGLAALSGFYDPFPAGNPILYFVPSNPNQNYALMFEVTGTSVPEPASGYLCIAAGLGAVSKLIPSVWSKFRSRA